MARLDPQERADLPDRAFAYVDSHGRRRLPIHDPPHIRNALARFSQVTFEDEPARDRARLRLLNAAKKYKIVPVGFIAGQLQSARTLGQHEGRPALPSGFVTMLMTDIESSTALVQRLAGQGGYEVEARADEFFAVFEGPRSAVDAAVSIQREFPGRSWPVDADVRVRIGIHSGYPTSTRTNYVGVDVNATSRICAVGHGGQVLVSANTRGGSEGVGSRRGAFHCARPPPVTGPA